MCLHPYLCQLLSCCSLCNWFSEFHLLPIMLCVCACVYVDILLQFSSVQSLSHVRLFVTPWIAPCQASLSITNSWSPPKPMFIELVVPSNHLILCCPLLLLPSHISQHQGLFQWVISLHQVTKVLKFQLQHQSFQWTPRTDLHAIQGTLKSFLQHHSLKASPVRGADRGSAIQTRFPQPG